MVTNGLRRCLAGTSCCCLVSVNCPAVIVSENLLALLLLIKTVALLYKERWQVELFFRWIKQHLRVKSFWGNTENAVRIQIYAAITTYCLVAIAEHDCQLNRSTFNVLRVLSHSLLDKTHIRDLFLNSECIDDRYVEDCTQLEFEFVY